MNEYFQWEKYDVIFITESIGPDQRRLREFYDWHSFVGDGNYIMHGVLWELIGNTNKKEKKNDTFLPGTNNNNARFTFWDAATWCVRVKSVMTKTHMHTCTMINFIKKILSQGNNKNNS